MKNGKRYISLFLLLSLISSLFGVFASADTAKPVITSGNMVVIRSVNTDQVLFDTGNADLYVTPTVSAKLMTSMIAFDMLDNLDAVVTVPAEVLSKENVGSTSVSAPMLRLSPGETYTVRQLLMGTLISSANDACFTLAYYASKGDIPLFVTRMNEKAASLGCTNTYYADPVGLYGIVSPEMKPGNGVAYTTAHDVAIVASAFYKYNELLKISEQPSYTLGGGTLHTKNYLLSKSLIADYYTPGVRGMIAGQASESGGYCLITSAESDGYSYVFVVMNAPGEDRKNDGTRSFPAGNAYEDVRKTIEWATTSFGYINLIEAGQIIGELPVKTAGDNIDHVSCVTAEEVNMLLPKNIVMTDVIKETSFDSDFLEAPVAKDAVVGTLSLRYDGRIIASVPIVTANAVEKSKILDLFDKFKKFLKSKWLRTVIKVIFYIFVGYLILLLGCFVYRIIIKCNANAQKKERAKQREAAKKQGKNQKNENNEKKK